MYTAYGRELEGYQWSRGFKANTRVPDISQCSPGQEVVVHCEPNAPENAYLEVNRSAGIVYWFVVGCIFVTIGILVPALVSFD